MKIASTKTKAKAAKKVFNESMPLLRDNGEDPQ